MLKAYFDHQVSLHSKTPSKHVWHLLSEVAAPANNKKTWLPFKRDVFSHQPCSFVSAGIHWVLIHFMRLLDAVAAHNWIPSPDQMNLWHFALPRVRATQTQLTCWPYWPNNSVCVLNLESCKEANDSRSHVQRSVRAKRCKRVFVTSYQSVFKKRLKAPYFHFITSPRPRRSSGNILPRCGVLLRQCVFIFSCYEWHESIRSGMRVCVSACVTHMLDRSSWQEEDSRRVFGLQRVNMVIWVLKLLLLPIEGCWYLVSEPMYLCRCHLRHFLLISPWTYNRLEQLYINTASVFFQSLSKAQIAFSS